MVEGRRKSRSMARVHKALPGGRNTTHYEDRRPKQVHCGECRAILHGIPRAGRAELRNMPKTQKRPERPFGGVLCSRCTRKRIVKAAVAEKKV
ncbi:MAG: 50S ribosomal protein L34e [archaeon]